MCSGGKELVQKSIIDLIVDFCTRSFPPSRIHLFMQAQSRRMKASGRAILAWFIGAEGGIKGRRRGEEPKAEHIAETKKCPYLDAQKASEALDWAILCRISRRRSRKGPRGLIRTIWHEQSGKNGGVTAEGGQKKKPENLPEKGNC